MKHDFTIAERDLDGIPAFLLVAQRRSFRAAAAELGVSPSALSQTIKALEARLGIALFHRTTRSVGLTEAGERLLEHARPAMAGLREALDAARSLSGRPSGLLRINASRGVIASLIGPVLPSFFAAHPEVEVEVFADDGFTDIVDGGFDAGFRLGESLQADMVAVRVSPPFRFVVVGAPDYFARRGRPTSPEELKQHDCIRFRQMSSQGIYRWELERDGHAFEVAVDGPLIVNDTAVSIAASLDGIGLSYVAEPLVEQMVEEGRLELVLQGYMPQTPGIFLYYPNRSHALPKLRAFVAHMRRALADYMKAREGLGEGRKRLPGG
ncbi:LysR family transcriptional regulator [Mesorhizobium sp. L-8-10]|uniref:LysR family transcriptional regulator n=1 Tax=Mesorhizobium sp. L-8-10 TaxID=2744523 RepID=UPI001927327D|nr:LysR family transcriptional regulator [Mesorhizobium sp. L-8-10]BCH28402.1 LysR family transcriptional regulator [Mesorhizobium sp. L-8-10]